MRRLCFASMLIFQVAGLILLAAPAFAGEDQLIGSGSSLVASVGRSNSLYVTGNNEDSASDDFMLAPSYAFNKDYSLSAVLAASQDLKEQQFVMTLARLSLKRYSGVDLLNHRVKWIPRISLSLPVNPAEQAASLQAGTTLGSRFELSPDYLISKKLGLAFDISGSRNFHTYDTAADGHVNTEYSTIQGVEVSWSFTDAISITTLFNHYDLYSYQGVASDFFSHNEEIDYQASKHYIFAVGHSWGNPFVPSRTPDGQDLQLNLLDSQNSFVYASILVII